MVNETTQALLNEVKSPKHARKSDVQSAIVGLIPLLAKISQQAAEIHALAQQAEISEDDHEVRGRMHHYIQISGGMQRICRSLEKDSRDLMVSWRNLQQADDEMRPKAKATGYEV